MFKKFRTIPIRWSTFVPFIFYILFISIILTISFPIKSLPIDKGPKSIDTSTDGDKSLAGTGNQLIDKIGNIDNDVLRNLIYNQENQINSLNLKQTNQMDSMDSRNDQDLLKVAFQKADLNENGLLNIQELARYINGRIRDHIDQAIRSNPIIFSEIDISPRDGLVSWDEYHAHFLRSHGLNDQYIRDHTESRHNVLDRKAKEEMMKDKAMWNEAARTDSFSLTLDEFLAFRHPESSATNLLSLVDDLLRQFDQDGDDVLTMDEFSDVSASDLEDKWRRYMISKTVQERQEEFKRLLDKNRDGRADRSELFAYVDPRHPRHSLQEAATLFSLADSNRDHKLSLNEILIKTNVFIASKMIDTSSSFHDEF